MNMKKPFRGKNKSQNGSPRAASGNGQDGQAVPWGQGVLGEEVGSEAFGAAQLQPGRAAGRR